MKPMQSEVAEICPKHGIFDATYYSNKVRYGEVSDSEIKSADEMETELSKPKGMYADLANRAMKDLFGSVAVREAIDNPVLGRQVSDSTENPQLSLHLCFPHDNRCSLDRFNTSSTTLCCFQWAIYFSTHLFVWRKTGFY